MITGKLSYIVSEADANGRTCYWGPFPDEETAHRWEGMANGSPSVYTVEQLRSAPQWSHGMAGGDPTDG